GGETLARWLRRQPRTWRGRADRRLHRSRVPEHGAAGAARLAHREAARAPPQRERPVDALDLLGVEPPRARAGVLGAVRGARCLRDREQRWAAHQEGEGDLARSGAVRGRDLLQHAVLAREVAVSERAVAHQRDTVALAPGPHRVLDGAL